MKELFQYSAKEIQNRHHKLVLNYRAQDRIFQSVAFKEAWKRTNEDERKYILNFFNDPNSYKLKRWVLKIMVGGLEQYPMGVLRQIASYSGVKNYSRMSKTQLLTILTLKGVTNGSENV